MEWLGWAWVRWHLSEDPRKVLCAHISISMCYKEEPSSEWAVRLPVPRCQSSLIRWNEGRVFGNPGICHLIWKLRRDLSAVHYVDLYHWSWTLAFRLVGCVRRNILMKRGNFSVWPTMETIFCYTPRVFHHSLDKHGMLENECQKHFSIHRCAHVKMFLG